MWQQEGQFRTLAPSDLRYNQSIPNFPEVQNQLTRLEIHSVLAIMNFPDAEEAIRTFLKEHSWGVSGVAAVLLLEEGDEAALEIVRELLNDPDQQVRIQAALVLALWGRDESAAETLQQAYPNADRQIKERILEGLGRIGAKDSLPFLVDRLSEPYQSLRIIAASAIVQCINH